MKKRILNEIVTSVLCITLAVITVLSCVSCSSAVLPAKAIEADELSAGYFRMTDESGTVSDDFKSEITDLSMTLFRKLVTNDKENDLVSPISAILCLAMLANGADGNTKKQIENVLGMDVDTLNECMYAYTSSLYSSDNCSVNIANSIWFRNNDNKLQISEDFLQTNADWYDAQIYSAPFNSSTVNDINNWCKEQTDGMIDNIIDRIDADTVMYLINALAFDAKWAYEYKSEDIKNGTFTCYDGTPKKVTMLNSIENVYISDDGVTGFVKDYKEGKYSFMALLPDKGTDIFDFVDTLDGDRWNSLLEKRENVFVDVKMPEFSYSAKMNLNEVLKDMGMTDMFTDNADFTKLGSYEGENLSCSQIDQKTYISVDSNGTKAAAVSWAISGCSGAIADEYVSLNRPFVYAIIDNASGIPLFVGVVTYLG